MKIIFLDLEFSSRKHRKSKYKYPFQIIEAGYIACDFSCNILETYSNLIKAENIESIESKIMDITNIEKSNLYNHSIPFRSFSARLVSSIDDKCYFVTWGNLDKKVLIDNFIMRKVDTKVLEESMFFDCQKAYMDKYELSKQPSLQKVADELTSLSWMEGHRALNDCYKTLEICKIIGLHNVLSQKYII